MPRRRSGKMLQLGDYSFCAPVARGPSISPAALTRAFNKTQSSTTDIVSRAGFIGYTEQVYPRILEICRIFVVDAFRKRKCDIRRLSEGQAISPICMGDDATMAQYLSCTALLADRRLGIDQTRPRRPGRRAHPARVGPRPRAAAHQGPPPVRAPRPHAHLHGRAPLGVVVRADGPRPRPLTAKAAGKRALAELRADDCTSAAFHGVMEDFIGGIVNAYDFAGSDPYFGGLNVLELGAGAAGTARWLAPLLKGSRPGLDGRVSYRLYDKEAGLLEDVREAFGGKYGIMMFNTRGVDEPPRPGEEGSQDIVVAVNAAHAAADKVGKSAAGGDFVYGFLEGWWRADAPFSNTQQPTRNWLHLIEEAGFRLVGYTTSDERDARFQRLFVLSTFSEDAAGDYAGYGDKEAGNVVSYVPGLVGGGGKVILVTGGNNGLGKETVLQLSKHNPAHIFMGARSEKKALEAVAEIRKAVPDAAKITFLKLDLASFESVKEAASSDTKLAEELWE
ncbi:Citrinin polyketide synthase [Colletotrichum orbiculare MAFF 240422]|uniref:Citrinin polyketide synthase n=1 Tax=Colletotrichum orbiculare (strain 104-T / ATCC 96160 / CBS 514.97 / LARS 414 / MAFF 240422) TaxID=1213857 RepID=A0A484G0W6_COLOR|nr:Citrinin polyketide synthase [Colletotrichum orbiculare MAFF 240422]